MSFSIQPLPTDVVHLIAAGEVIDSLAAVVRELIENSLDAGATRIVVSLWPQQWRVSVADNGCGMKLLDQKQAASGHSTSKIRSREDLWQITTLGFRGEALHSLAQLSELEILSRASGGNEGCRVAYCSQGKPLQIETAAIAPGTVVTVSNLFANWPNRRQGLPCAAQQMKAVQTTIQLIALCHPHVTWQVWQNNREWFNLSPGVTTKQLLPQILRQVRLSDLQMLQVEVPSPEEATTPQSSLQLVLGLPDRCHRHRPDWIRVAVNGRMVKSKELEQTIITALSRTLPRDRYPVCFLHLQILPHQIDWNRHPAKTEMYLLHLDYWQEQTTQAIEQALRISAVNLPSSIHMERVGKLIKAAEEQGAYNVSRSIQPAPSSTQDPTNAEGKNSPHSPLPNAGDYDSLDQSNKPAPPQRQFAYVGEPANATGSSPLQLQAVAQVHNTYILAEHPNGLWLVEQHIAHERILFEQLCDRWQHIPLEPPVILKALSLAQRSQLQRLGLEVEPFGEQLWAVRNAPALLQKRDSIAEALLELSWGGDLQSAQVAVACRSAIRNGTPLSLQDMQTLLDQWQRTRHPRTCPHGRPIYLSLEESALARFFRRHWVIGKSHGI